MHSWLRSPLRYGAAGAGNIVLGVSKRVAALGVVAACLTGGVAHAQQQVSRTSDYTVTWSGSAFSGASALYGGSQAYTASAFTDAAWNFTPLSNATDLTFNEGGGVTLSLPSLTPTPPYPATISFTYSSDGSLGYWGWTENTAATDSGPVLTYGRLGNLQTLTFTGGGSETRELRLRIRFLCERVPAGKLDDRRNLDRGLHQPFLELGIFDPNVHV